MLYSNSMKVLRRIAPIAVIAAAALLLLYSPDIAPERYTDLATFFRVEMKRQGYSGFSVAAVSDGSVLYVDGFGKDGSGAPIGPDTRLYAPAAAKSMAALCAYSLVREGLLSLDMSVSSYLPWFVEGVTIRHLISHTSGFSDDDFDDLHPSALGLEAAARLMSSSKPEAAPGQAFRYLDTDYQVLALVMEKAAGQPYSELLAARVLAPLGLSSSDARVPAVPPRGSAYFFALSLPRAPSTSAVAASSGYLVSSAADIGKYMAYLLGPEKTKRGPLPTRAVISLFDPLSPHAPYGYGLFIGQDDEGRVAYHDGSLDGFSSRLVLWPDKRAGVAVLAPQGSLLQSLIALPALTEGARRIMRDGESSRPFPLGRLYILLAVVAIVHLLALVLQTGGALAWAKGARDKAEAKGSRGPILFARIRCWVGIALRIGIVLLCPIAVGLAFGRGVSWRSLLQLEPSLAVWCLFACLFGVLRNISRLTWLGGASGIKRLRN
jgi:CubicO group peptidase (beta-lactamase class C family)